MSEQDWWRAYGPFKPWRECPTRPDPVDVLLFYLEKSSIGPEEHMAYLTDLLGLQKSMVYNILKGEGFDSITRCRILVQALKIHPPLLGLDAHYYPIERYPSWWRRYGFDFQADASGYPLISEVVAFLRMQRAYTTEEGKVKMWTQEDLGDATGLKKETVYRMEHNDHPLILDSMSRRVIVASALGTLAENQESTLFRLFGLDPQAYGLPVSARDVIVEVHDLPERLTDETLDEYRQQLATFFTAYYTSHAQDRIGEVQEWVRRLEVLQSRAETAAQRVKLLALECQYHQLLACLAREQCQTQQMTAHATFALSLAEQALDRLPELGDRTLCVLSHELVAAALFWRADAYAEFDDYELAQKDIDRAFDLLPATQVPHLKLHILALAGLIHAHTATGEADRVRVSSYFQRAAQMALHLGRQATLLPDDHFIRGDSGLLSLYKARAWSTPLMRGTSREQVREYLETAQKFTPPELIRQRTLIQVFQAVDYFAAGDYPQAVSLALDALEKSRQIRSHPSKDRIEDLYEQLLETDCRATPFVSYLGVKLRTWNYGLD